MSAHLSNRALSSEISVPSASDPRCPVTEQAMEFEYAVQSTYAAVRATLEHLLGDLRKAGTDAEDIGTIELVLAEALNNVVEHAYREAPDNVFELGCSVCGTDVCFRIIDQGVAMPGLALPEGKLPSADLPIEDLPEGGFGWHLIHLLTEELVYHRRDDRNQTSFIIPLTSGD